MSNDITGPAGFETHIKPMFSERDRRAMQSGFDLWSYDDVSRNADAILTRLRDGTMPCDDAWPVQRNTQDAHGCERPTFVRSSRATTELRYL